MATAVRLSVEQHDPDAAPVWDLIADADTPGAGIVMRFASLAVAQELLTSAGFVVSGLPIALPPAYEPTGAKLFLHLTAGKVVLARRRCGRSV